MRRESHSGPFSRHASLFVSALPEEGKAKFRSEQAAKRIQSQFAQLVSGFILEHTNAVYLLEDDLASPSVVEAAKGNGHRVKRLTVYVDDSTVAAELNARRELIKLKYLEQFSIKLTSFDIRISKGKYRDRHPYAEVSDSASPKVAELPESVRASIEEAVSSIEDEKLRASFERAMAANARKQQKD